MTINEFAAEVHKNAVDHGWWEGERTFPEIVVLIHSEVSEALEEYRDGKPLLYFPCNAGGVCCEEDGSAHCGSRPYDPENPNARCSAQSKKPEGIAAELADVIIRVLDYCAYAGIDIENALEAATSGLQGIEAFCTANAIKYLWRWKLKNGEEDLQKAVWYINRLIQRAGADSAAGKELFNMKENKHGFEPKQEFTMGGIAWTVIQTGTDWVKCIASDCVEERAFDEENKNDFAASSLRAYLNGEFLRRLIKAGAPEEMFEYFNIDLTADDGLKNYGGDRVRIGLITCEEYRLLRGNIPALPDRWWWTATPDSPINSFVRSVYSDGSLYSDGACNGSSGVRPLCNLKSEILVSYLNGENAEEQKKRAEAVDMMKHIAAAWDIDAEEVFGRADE